LRMRHVCVVGSRGVGVMRLYCGTVLQVVL